MTFTTNLCTNPSFEAGTTGYTALNGAVLGTDPTTAVFGSVSMVVSTPGIVPGEGFTGPATTLGSNTTCSLSLYISGQTGSNTDVVGTVTVAAITSGGAVLSQVTLPVPIVFTRVVLNSLAVTSGNTLAVMVTTPISQELLFWVDGVQYEPESPAQPYIDGDQLGCFWNGTAELSSSYQPYEFFIDSSGTSRADGYANVIAQGEIFAISGEVVGEMEFSGTAGEPSVLQPVAAFDDFAIYSLTDVDPALSYPSWNNEGILSGHTGYNRSYAMFTPPLDYIVSGGNYLWRRAAFAGLGWQFSSVPAGQAQNLTNAQVEFAMINGTNPVVPRAFEPPRQVYVNVQPDRLNLCTNPSFEVSLAGWSLTGTNASITQDGTQSVPDVGTFANVAYGAGNYSMNTTINAGTQQSVSIVIPDLIIGRQYAASAYIMTTEGFDDIYMTIADGSADLSKAGGDPPYGGDLIFPGYSEEFYGGIGDFVEIPPVSWTRLSCFFTANFDMQTLSITASVDGAAVYPVTFWVDAVLVEPGEIAQPYFDGSFGEDALWEFGGTAGLTRSYYYTQLAQKEHIVTDALNSNIPLGISYAPWTYAGGAVATATGSGSSSGSGSGGGGGGSGTSIIYSTAGTYNWTAPAGVTVVYAECWGAGGGGMPGLYDGGGGGGEYAAEATLAVVAGHTYTFTVGAGGAGGVGSGFGIVGGNTSFPGTSVTVTAHGGGVSNASAITPLGGHGSTNSVHFNGGNSSAENAISGDGAGGGSSAGPSSAGNPGENGDSGSLGGTAVSAGGPGGNGGLVSGGSVNGSAPSSGPGGGAGGGAFPSHGGAGSGGKGADGQVRLTYA